jgi:hypothetical protein
MDASLLLPGGGARSLGKFKLYGGQRHELFFVAPSSADRITYRGKLVELKDLADKPLELMRAHHALRTAFLAKHLVNEDGSPLFASAEQALLLDFDLAKRLHDRLSEIDSEVGDEAGQD